MNICRCWSPSLEERRLDWHGHSCLACTATGDWRLPRSSQVLCRFHGAGKMFLQKKSIGIFWSIFWVMRQGWKLSFLNAGDNPSECAVLLWIIRFQMVFSLFDRAEFAHMKLVSTQGLGGGCTLACLISINRGVVIMSFTTYNYDYDMWTASATWPNLGMRNLEIMATKTAYIYIYTVISALRFLPVQLVDWMLSRGPGEGP